MLKTSGAHRPEHMPVRSTQTCVCRHCPMFGQRAEFAFLIDIDRRCVFTVGFDGISARGKLRRKVTYVTRTIITVITVVGILQSAIYPHVLHKTAFTREYTLAKRWLALPQGLIFLVPILQSAPRRLSIRIRNASFPVAECGVYVVGLIKLTRRVCMHAYMWWRPGVGSHACLVISENNGKWNSACHFLISWALTTTT